MEWKTVAGSGHKGEGHRGGGLALDKIRAALADVTCGAISAHGITRFIFSVLCPSMSKGPSLHFTDEPA